MQLKMFLKGELIDSLPVNSLLLSSPDYITYLQYELALRNEELLSNFSDEPEFAIDTIPSLMNTFRSHLEEVLRSLDKDKKNME